MAVVKDIATFWLDCVLKGWEVGGGIVWQAELIFLLIVAGRYTFKKTTKKQFEAAEDKFLRVTFWILILSFTFSTIFIAPFLKYQEARSTHSDEAKHDIPYDVITNQLSEANLKRETERKRADAEHNRADTERQNAEQYRALLMQAYSSTNAPHDLDPLHFMVRNMEQALPPLNPKDREALKRRVDAEIALGKGRDLEKQQAEVERIRKSITPIYPIWADLIARFQTILSERVKGCGKLQAISLPTIDTATSRGRKNTDVGTITFETNSTWTCQCKLLLEGVESPTLTLECSGHKVKPARLVVGYCLPSGEDVCTTLHIDNVEVMVRTNCPIAGATNCIEIVDNALGILTSQQGEEFE